MMNKKVRKVIVYVITAILIVGVVMTIAVPFF